MMIKKFDCLHRDTNIFGNHFLQASAGTGKTFAIEHLVVRLLLEKRETPFFLEKILICTFTRAATRDVKNRIRKNIEMALSFFKQSHSSLDDDSIFDYIIPYLSLTEEERAKIVRTLEDALYSFDMAHIFTIHGFCQRMLFEFSFDAGAIVQESFEERDEGKELLHKKVLDFLHYFVSQDMYSDEQLFILFSKYKEPSILCNMLLQYSEKKLDIQKVSIKDTFSSFSLALSGYCVEGQDFSQKIFEDFSLLRELYKKTKFQEKELLIQLQILSKIVEEKKCSYKDFEYLIKMKFSLFSFLDEKNKKKRIKKEFSYESLHYPEFFSWAKNSLYPLIQKVSDPHRIFLSLAKDLFEYMQTTGKEEVFSFDGVLRDMAINLEKESFRKQVQNRYQAAIIDEFQDTDPIQWEIFEKLFLNKKESKLDSFFLVGDPKQSIYSFRNADLYSYLKAADLMGEDAIFHLDTNYRSYPFLVDSLNALFMKNSWLKVPKWNQYLPYYPVKSKKEEQKPPLTKGALHFFVAEDKPTSRWPSSYIEDSLFFPYITKEIQKLHDTLFISYGDIAILVKDRYQARRIKAYLQNANIPCVAKNQPSLITSQSFRALKELFEAIDSPHDISKIKRALAGPYIQWSAKQIKELQGMNIFLKFITFKQVLQKQGVFSFFHEFFHSSWGDEVVYEKLVMHQDLSLYRDTMQIIELFVEYVTKNALSLENYFQFFDMLYQRDLQDDGLVKKGAIVEEEGVQIMTMHVSKGLEFEVVFALGLASRTPYAEMEIFYQSLLSKNQKDLFLEELDAEKMRQFYVALTRAKRCVYAPVALMKEAKAIKPSTISCMELFLSHMLKTDDDNDLYRLAETIDKGKLEDVFSDLVKQSHLYFSFLQEDLPTKKSLLKEDPLHLVKKEYNKELSIGGYTYSFSHLHKKTKGCVFSEEPKQEVVVDDKVLPLGSETGIILHRILESIFKCKKSYDTTFITRVIEKEIAHTFLETKKEYIFEIIKRLLQVPLLNERETFCLTDILHDNIFVEMEFFFPWLHQTKASDYMKGFIDLVFMHEKKYYLIDWKSNYLPGGYDKPSMQKAMEKNDYFLQAAIYMEALSRYIKIFDNRPFSECFGGAFYIFLRGLLSMEGKKQTGVFHFYPNISLLEEASKGVMAPCMD